MTNRYKTRRLKLREVGDFYIKKSIRLLRLSGQWLTQAGIISNTYVKIERLHEGVLLISTLLADDRECRNED